jgi:hypothetical protein
MIQDDAIKESEAEEQSENSKDIDLEDSLNK